MDIGTTKEPGRELKKQEVGEISGGNIGPLPEDLPPPDDLLGGSPQPVDP